MERDKRCVFDIFGQDGCRSQTIPSGMGASNEDSSKLNWLMNEDSMAGMFFNQQITNKSGNRNMK